MHGPLILKLSRSCFGIPSGSRDGNYQVSDEEVTLARSNKHKAEHAVLGRIVVI